MKNPVQRTERAYFKIIAWLVGGILLLAFLSWAGFRAYHSWQERHLVRRAAGYLSGGDVKQASLSARRAYQINPESAGAARMLAEIAERSGDGTELEWRRKVFSLRPDSVDDALALVRSALRANELPTAERTLQAIATAAEQVPSYHAALGQLTEMRGKAPEAEKHWQRASELAPTESAYQVQLALVQLSGVDQAKRDRARETLERFRTDEKQRAAATRALIIDGAARNENPQRLRALAADLQEYPEVKFTDRLLYLEMLRQLRDPGYDEYRRVVEQEALKSPTDIASLISLMSVNASPAEAIAFSRNAPAEALATWPTPLTLAEAYSRAGDWPGLRQVVEEKDWGGFEFMRQAYLARASRGEEKQVAAEQEWWRATKLATPQPQALLLLARTISGWGWEQEMVDLLWTLSKTTELRREALQQLYQHYASRGDTAGLYRVLSRGVEVAPDDLMMQNNLAQVALLLRADSKRARRLATEVVKQEPGNAAYVSTYAYSLYTEGDRVGALEEIEKLSPDQLETPSIALYYGVILAAADQKEKARGYLERAAKTFLLPEEKALLEKAQNATR
ncbi:MAG: hypothetical protein H0V56_11405 [Chthoniobacterales bacterium]|nr:hypothetical protein [Chthoniobacterales bacterium]